MDAAFVRNFAERYCRPALLEYALPAACAIALFQSAAHAVTYTVGNKYVQAMVDGLSGQIIRIEKMPSGAELIYEGSETSHTNFYILDAYGSPEFLTNNSDNYGVSDGTYTAVQKFPDAVYQSADTIVADWKNVYGFEIKQYVYPFFTYSSGQIAIEYRTFKADSNTNNKLLGILLELDIAVQGKSSCGTAGDNSLILDSRRYDALPNIQGCWDGVQAKYVGANVPDWFESTGGFDYNSYPSCTSCTFATGKLRNPSVVAPLAGPTLVAPDEFYVGEWGRNSLTAGLKNVVWNVAAPNFDTSVNYRDVAVVYKWQVRSQNAFRCCTSYGPNDFTNDNYICDSRAFFLNLRFPERLLHNPDGTYTPPIDTLQVWATNIRADDGVATNTLATLDTTNTCLLLAPGETLTKKVIGDSTNNLLPSKTGFCQWRFLVDTSRCCIPGQDVFETDSVKVAVTCAEFPVFAQPCYPTVHVDCRIKPPDTLPPVAIRTRPSFGTFKWDAQDHRQWDTGIDTIIVALADNFTVSYAPDPFTKCDTGQVVVITGNVNDTTSTACMSVYVVDCSGNVDTIMQCYPGIPDTLAPLFATVDSSKAAVGSSSCDQNYRCKTIKVYDNRSIPPVSGLKNITVTNNINYVTTIYPFVAGAKIDTIDACVSDSLYNASLTLLATDTAGNSSEYSIGYCTIRDTLPPLIVGGNNGTIFRYTVTEKRPWDRGLLEIDTSTLAKVNFKVDSLIYEGDTSAIVQLSVLDTSKDGNFCFIARDSFFADETDNIRFGGDSANHETVQCGQYVSGTDTLPPDVALIPDPANDAQVTVVAWDKHWVNGALYLRDKKLSSVDFSNAVNIDTTAKPVIKTCVDDSLQFQVSVADTLSLADTQACFTVGATDCQGLHSPTARWCYTVIPDTLPPQLAFAMGVTRDTVWYRATDDRRYDRGLATIVFDSIRNVEPFADTTLDGAPAKDFALHIIDTTKPAHAHIVITDLYSSVHPLQLPAQQTSEDFDSYVVPVWLDSLTVARNGAQFSIPVHIAIGSGNMQIRTVTIIVHFEDSLLSFAGAAGANASIVASAADGGTANGIHSETILFSAAPQFDPALQTLGYLAFNAPVSRYITTANVWIDSAVFYNDYKTDTLYRANALQPRLAPFAAVTQNAGVAISGECQQILIRRSAAPLALEQNTPNPFTNETTIHYALDRSGEMNLAVYNALGERVALLVQGNEKPGEYRLSYDASHLRPGIYYYRLETIGAALTRAMIIMR